MTQRIRFYEWLAGKLLVRATRLRVRRMAPDDAHELRHLWAAINAGNSEGCADGDCTLARYLGSEVLAEFPVVWRAWR